MAAYPTHNCGERRVIEILENESRRLIDDKPLLDGADKNQDRQQRSFSNFFFRPGVLGRDLHTIIKFGLVQYMILKTFCAFLAFLLELFGVYGDGEFKWYDGYPYIAVVLNFSQMWALYCLVQFYNVTHERLQSIRPLSKFISFKAIVFATWWQGVGIALLCAFGVLPKEGKFQTGLQDFLICIEMAIAAVAHVYVFSAKPYHYIPASNFGRVTTDKTRAPKLEDNGEKKPDVLEKTETQVNVPGTSVTESVQDIVLEGGQRVSNFLPVDNCHSLFGRFSIIVRLTYIARQVVKDVVLTINQAIGPVEKGVAKIQETFHHRSVGSVDKEEELESELEIKELFEENEFLK